MEKVSNLNILIEDFRAVKTANISIDGITLLAGENGSGKSTISKLIYYLYKTISNYDFLVGENLNRELRNVFTFIDISINEVFRNKNDRQIRSELLKELNNIREDLNYNSPTTSQMNNFLNFITKVQISVRMGNDLDLGIFNRLEFIAKDITKKISINDNTKDSFEIIKIYIENCYKEAFGHKNSRSTKIFKNELVDVFHDSNLPKRFNVYEFGQEIISLTKNNLSIPYFIQNVIYIDTPMMLGIETLEYNHWDDLNDMIKSSNQNNFTNFSNFISEQIINGEANYDDNYLTVNDFTFKRSDGSIFNLLDCATGIKSFSILQLLIKNGAINDKTLLIIDEPESNLHPQWIVEYARLIVLLNKEIGMKFLLASHNPDMVSSIKIIGEKEGILNQINFYLAKKHSKFTYDFVNLHQDIDPIFESFNIAFERINLYGGE